MTEFFHSSAFDWDKNLFQFINSHNSPFWDKVMWVITSTQFGLLFSLILSLLIVYFYRKQSWKILLLIAAVTLMADAIGARVLKPTVQRLRPSHDAEYHGDYQVQKAHSVIKSQRLWLIFWNNSQKVFNYQVRACLAF